MNDNLFNTEGALIKAAERWENGFYKNKQEPLSKPLDVDYESIKKSIFEGLNISNSEKRIMINAGLDWGEYSLNELDENTRNLLGKK